MVNSQAQAAGQKADDIIKNLSNPAQAIVTEQTTVEVLDKAKPVIPTPPAEPVKTDDVGNWENRFKGLKASQDKTIHALRQQVNNFDLMTTENERLKKQLEDTQEQVPKTPDEMLKLFSQEEVDSVRGLVDGQVGGLKDEVSRLQGQLAKVKEAEDKADAVNAHQSVVDAVANAVPNYTEIDNNPEFGEWINDVDVYGNVRYEMFMKAKHSSPPDIGRLVQFYVDFANQSIPAQDEPRKQFTQQELSQNPTSQPSASPESPQGLGIVWDLETINLFYKDKAIGKISPERAEELEKDLYRSRKG